MVFKIHKINFLTNLVFKTNIHLMVHFLTKLMFSCSNIFLTWSFSYIKAKKRKILHKGKTLIYGHKAPQDITKTMRLLFLHQLSFYTDLVKQF